LEEGEEDIGAFEPEMNRGRNREGKERLGRSGIIHEKEGSMGGNLGWEGLYMSFLGNSTGQGKGE